MPAMEFRPTLLPTLFAIAFMAAMVAVAAMEPIKWKRRPMEENPPLMYIRMRFWSSMIPAREPSVLTPLPTRLMMKKAKTALVNTVVAVPTTPPAPETEDKIGALTFVVAILMELGILRLDRPIMLVSHILSIGREIRKRDTHQMLHSSRTCIEKYCMSIAG